MYTHMYMYVCVCMCVYIYIYNDSPTEGGHAGRAATAAVYAGRRDEGPHGETPHPQKCRI